MAEGLKVTVCVSESVREPLGKDSVELGETEDDTDGEGLALVDRVDVKVAGTLCVNVIHPFWVQLWDWVLGGLTGILHELLPG